MRILPLLLFTFATLSCAAAPTETCRFIPGPVQQQTYTVSATQVGGELVLADVWNQELLRYPLARGTFNRIEVPFQRSLNGAWPAAIHSAGDDLILELGGGHPGFVKLNRSLAERPGSTRSVVGRVAPDDTEITSTWIWRPLGSGGEIIACSDVYLGEGARRSKESYYTGIVRFAYDDPSSFETLVRLPAAAPLRLACRLPMELIATLGDTAYFMLPGLEPLLYRHQAGAAEPERLSTTPQLSGWLDDSTPELSRNSFAEVMSKIERTAMPVGLFGWESNLYLLSRRPADRGVEWSLTRLDPDTGEERGTMRIDSDANHLLLVPGDEHWAVVEKSRMEALGYQDVLGVLAIPSEQIRSWSDGGVICQRS